MPVIIKEDRNNIFGKFLCDFSNVRKKDQGMLSVLIKWFNHFTFLSFKKIYILADVLNLTWLWHEAMRINGNIGYVIFEQGFLQHVRRDRTVTGLLAKVDAERIDRWMKGPAKRAVGKII